MTETNNENLQDEVVAGFSFRPVTYGKKTFLAYQEIVGDFVIEIRKIAKKETSEKFGDSFVVAHPPFVTYTSQWGERRDVIVPSFKYSNYLKAITRTDELLGLLSDALLPENMEGNSADNKTAENAEAAGV